MAPSLSAPRAEGKESMSVHENVIVHLFVPAGGGGREGGVESVHEEGGEAVHEEGGEAVHEGGASQYMSVHENMIVHLFVPAGGGGRGRGVGGE
eukprot:366432-Chlamydomonas_euryale.AAC.4